MVVIGGSSRRKPLRQRSDMRYSHIREAEVDYDIVSKAAFAVTVVASATSSLHETMSQSLGKEKGNENRGQKRKADEALVSAAEQPDSCKLVELPQEVLCHVLSFQAEKDLFFLSVMCSNLLKAVEAFSERALEEMKRKHKVDDTWEARISDQSSIKTDMEGPLELPNRYLLWKARRTHLYKLENMGGCNGLGVLPDGERLVSMGRGKIIRMWDLSTKNNRILYDGGNERSFGLCFLCGEHVVATSGGRIRVLSLDGNTVYNVEPPDDGMHVSSITTSQKKVFFAFFGRNEIISCLGLVTGFVQEHEARWGEEMNDEDGYLHFGACGSMLLALDRYAGIHVIDVRNFSLSQFLAGYYTSMVEATGDTNTFVASKDDTIEVMALENGLFSSRFSFLRYPHPSAAVFFSIRVCLSINRWCIELGIRSKTH